MLAKRPAADEAQISKDVFRTEIAKGLTEQQRQEYYGTIRRVLTAYSNLCPQVGYIQGMNVIVSSLIYSLCDSWDEIGGNAELAFRLMVSLLEDSKVSEFYKTDMKRMLSFFGRIEERVRDEFPLVYKRLTTTEVG